MLANGTLFSNGSYGAPVPESPQRVPENSTPLPPVPYEYWCGGDNVKIVDATQGFLDGYFSTCTRSAKTRSAYKTDLAQLIEYLGPELALSDVSAEVLEKWAVELRSQEYHSVSIRRKFATDRVFFAYWIRKGVIGSSPLWKIRLDLGRERLLRSEEHTS